MYGIIGYPLVHSCSPAYFNERFRAEGIDEKYLSFEIQDIRILLEIIEKHPDLRGFNVTIPHKQNILPYLDEISEEAAAIGAVNCVRVCRDNGKPRLTGYNTDMYGFRKALTTFIPPRIRKALVLGNGGAAKAVRYALKTLDIEYLTVSRHPARPGEIGYPETEKYIPGSPLIINTTPLGTWPHTETYPAIRYEKLTPGHYLFDLVYNPSVTAFMKRGAASGARTCNGYAMWLAQAEKNREIWKI